MGGSLAEGAILHGLLSPHSGRLLLFLLSPIDLFLFYALHLFPRSELDGLLRQLVGEDRRSRVLLRRARLLFLLSHQHLLCLLGLLLGGARRRVVALGSIFALLMLLKIFFLSLRLGFLLESTLLVLPLDQGILNEMIVFVVDFVKTRENRLERGVLAGLVILRVHFSIVNSEFCESHVQSFRQFYRDLLLLLENKFIIRHVFFGVSL